MAKTVVRSALDSWQLGQQFSSECALYCEDPSLTVQSDKDDADINVILDRFGITGQLPQNVRAPTFEVFDDVFDFRSAVEAVAMAEDSFMAMPAKVRAEFENDPQQFLEFCTASKDGMLVNLARMRELGLAVPEKKPEPEKVQKVEVVNPSTK